jgi:hypothetical protein
MWNNLLISADIIGIVLFFGFLNFPDAFRLPAKTAKAEEPRVTEKPAVRELAQRVPSPDVKLRDKPTSRSVIDPRAVGSGLSVAQRDPLPGKMIDGRRYVTTIELVAALKDKSRSQLLNLFGPAIEDGNRSCRWLDYRELCEVMYVTVGFIKDPGYRLSPGTQGFQEASLISACGGPQKSPPCDWTLYSFPDGTIHDRFNVSFQDDRANIISISGYVVFRRSN